MPFLYAFIAFVSLILAAVASLGALLAPTPAMGWALSGCILGFFACMAWVAGRIDD